MSDGEDPQQIFPGEKSIFSIAWSPSGRRLALYKMAEDYNASVVSCDAAGSDGVVLHSLKVGPGWSGILSLIWIADGGIVFSRFFRRGDTELWAIEADPNTGRKTGEPTQLTSLGRILYPASATADGKHLVVSAERDENTMQLARP